ncbi:MAG: GTPase HflX, partial [Deltaproteobacteria bacterium]|nr:GTPase HflX [Deltaproteobacteria bacterium]
MESVHGKTGGLKASQIKQLQNLYRRRVSGKEIITHELTRQLSLISHEIQRQVALLLTRRGDVAYVVVGDNRHILIPDLGRFRLGKGRLKGLRCIHTHLHGEPLSGEDLSDLVLLGLDLMVTVQVGADGIPGAISYAHILPENIHGKGWNINQVPDIGQLDVAFPALIQSLEDELARSERARELDRNELAVLVGVSTGPVWKTKESLEELRELAISSHLEVVDVVIQSVKRSHPRFLIGKGKLRELVLRCLQTGCNLLIFDHELTPAQVRTLTDLTELKIIDRSQLILDIFARRAVTREGKIQVELAQLKYLLPRLATKNTAMSRLTGGIGGRGPGETKLEINRRRVRERIARLNRELRDIKRQREDRRRLRNVKRLPVISIVGYTNAGKSTLLNALTHSQVFVEDRLFATLDPSSRRLRFPREREVIITDTVGFIRDLPEDLMEAFAATLEELQDADLLLHVVDLSSPRMEEQILTVEGILRKLDLERIPTVLVLNKSDRIDPQEALSVARSLNGVAISAIERKTFHPLLSRIETFLWPEPDFPSAG